MCFKLPTVKASRDPLTPGRDLYNAARGRPQEKDAPTETAVEKVFNPKIPEPPQTPPPPQAAKAPDTAPLKRRNTGGGIAVPQGSTMLSGPSGIATSQLALGSQTLLGGG
jgi:hypothetical protein